MSNNPLLSEKVLNNNTTSQSRAEGSVMTVNGTIQKTLILLFITVVTAGVSWKIGQEESLIHIRSGMLIGSSIVGLILVLILGFNPHLSRVLAPLYAFVEGIFLGIVSAIYAALYQGIVVQAVLLTLSVLAIMLLLYSTGTIKVTDRLRSIIVSATLGIFIFYVISFILGFFNIHIPLIHSNGILGIGFSLFVVGLAAFNLLLDFDFIEKGASSHLPKNFEWYGAFGIMVTLIWLYIEVLRLLSKFQRD